MGLYVGSTSLLLHGDGADGSTVFTDETGKAVTAYGDAKISTAQSKFGGSSMTFDGGGDFLGLASSDSLDFGMADFTWECWIRRHAVTEGVYADALWCAKVGPVGFAVAINPAGHIGICASSTGVWDIHIGADPGNPFGATALALDTWYHIAVCRQGSNWVGFVDGVLDQSFVSSGNVSVSSGGYFVGHWHDGNNRYFNGHIDDLRIVKGAALYTTGFTPPTAPLESVGGTLIQIQRSNTDPQKLCHFDPSQVKPVISEVKNDLQDRWPYGPWKTPAVQWEFKGRGRITGTVAEKALPVNTPLRRLVRLHREPDGALVQATWSDATTGVYTFNGVRPDRKYFVTSFDYTNTYRAVIADNLSPTAL